MTKPDYLFEVSWEICNKIGGIHTVISTKVLSVINELHDHYIAIGPDVWRESGQHPEFEEDLTMFADWKENAGLEGIRVRTGRWKISGNPVAVLIDFTPFFSKKDEVFKKMWEAYNLDSISGQWDYIEPTLFGYAAGKTIESFSQYYGLFNKNVAAHFHEWQTGAGLLYLEQSQPKIGTVFTTHATVVGRAVAGNNQPLYSNMENYNGDTKARELNVISKHSLEKIAANNADAFTTVSELTARECRQFHGKDVDVLTPNGFEDSYLPAEDEFSSKRETARKRLLQVASAITGEELSDDTLLIATSGRYEFHNKGIDLMIDALGQLNRNKSCKSKAVTFLLIPANHYGPRKDLLEKLNDPGVNLNGEKFLTHYLHYAEHDLILNRIKQNNFRNSHEDNVLMIFVPSYLNGNDGIFNMSYYDLLIGFDLTLFPSYYEPWGYT
ncbi:MAG TPA: alpha-glucan family phosphorylase, partial [Bacteroidaceae bacterium]|nr:alpha-glucan family phosphorylase [Bacteroidaceae bacterium]